MKKINFLTIFTLFYINFLSSALVEIKITNPDLIKTLANKNIPIFHIFENSIIAEMSETEISLYNAIGLDIKILDYNPWEMSYYLLTSKTDKFAKLTIPNAEILYSDSKNILLKSVIFEPDVIKKLGYDFIKLQRVPLKIDTQNYIVKDIRYSQLDSLINYIISEINPDSVRYFIQSLQDFGTRFLFAPNRDSVSSWIYHQFKRMGYEDVQYDEFTYQSTLQRNVVATITGSVNPDAIYVIGGHHDSYSNINPMQTAPGADDNASGTAAVLEIARVIKKKNYTPEATFKFITFAAEEYGLIGAYNFASKARNNNMNIKLMMNHDMISYLNTNQSDRDFLINRYTNSESFAEIMFNNAKRFTNLNPRYGGTNSSNSDSYAFWKYGYNATYSAEADFSPYYHSPNDLIQYNNMPYCAEIIKVSAATLITLSVIPSTITNLQIFDVGNGNTIKLTWFPNTDTDFNHYKIYVGKNSGNYDTVYTTTQNLIYISDLITDQIYYFGVCAVDNNNFESPITELSIKPKLIPRVPTGLSSDAGWHAVYLTWNKNSELDILGYNIYRTKDTTLGYIKINSHPILGSSFVDSELVSKEYFYYKITAVDSDYHESNLSVYTKAKPVSLQYGILLVDETKNGNGTIFNPTDNESDNFYKSLLTGFEYDEYDAETNGKAKLSDLGAYSTIIWYADEYTDYTLPQNTLNGLKRYLLYGGKLLVTIFLPCRSFSGITNFPHQYSPGDLMYDWFKIQKVESKPLSRFNGAIPVESSGYDYLEIDSSKSLETYNFHIPNVEAIYATDDAKNIFTFNTAFDTTTMLGSLKNKPVGVEYLGNDYKLVILSFPLYYINYLQAYEFIRKVLLEKFSESLIVEVNNTLPEKFYLLQNYPNPFNNSTQIQFGIPEDSRIKIKIYNILGQEIKLLIDKELEKGNYKIEWDGRNNTGTIAPSGIYICRLEYKSGFLDQKMILIK